MSFAAFGPAVWLVGLALLAGAYAGGRWHQWQEDEQDLVAAKLEATEKAREREAQWQSDVEVLTDVQQTEIRRVAAARDAAVRELRNRPDRLPEASTAACDGATGAQLSRPDAAFLVGEAARADQLRADLAACEGWVETVRSERNEP